MTNKNISSFKTTEKHFSGDLIFGTISVRGKVIVFQEFLHFVFTF